MTNNGLVKLDLISLNSIVRFECLYCGANRQTIPGTNNCCYSDSNLTWTLFIRPLHLDIIYGTK